MRVKLINLSNERQMIRHSAANRDFCYIEPGRTLQCDVEKARTLLTEAPDVWQLARPGRRGAADGQPVGGNPNAVALLGALDDGSAEAAKEAQAARQDELTRQRRAAEAETLLLREAQHAARARDAAPVDPPASEGRVDIPPATGPQVGTPSEPEPVHNAPIQEDLAPPVIE